MIRFRLDSATAGEVARVVKRHVWNNNGQTRGDRLLLHWWAVGHDPARAIRNRKVGER